MFFTPIGIWNICDSVTPSKKYIKLYNTCKRQINIFLHFFTISEPESSRLVLSSTLLGLKSNNQSNNPTFRSYWDALVARTQNILGNPNPSWETIVHVKNGKILCDYPYCIQRSMTHTQNATLPHQCLSRALRC